MITMFDYKEFKKEMCKRGHEVHKHGDYITIEPNNNYEGYNKGFLYSCSNPYMHQMSLKDLSMN